MNPTTASTMMAGTMATISSTMLGISSTIESMIGPMVPLRSIAADAAITIPESGTIAASALTFQRLLGFLGVAISCIIKRHFVVYLMIAP